MGLFTRWVELFITQENEKFVNVSMLLENAGIEYKEKIQNIGHSNRRSGYLGSLGENPRYANMYQVFVKKTDVEKAKAVISHKL